MAVDIEVIDLSDRGGREPARTVRSRRPRWPVVAIALVLGVAVVTRLAIDDGSPAAPTTTVPSSPPDRAAAPAAGDGPAGDGRAGGPRSEVVFEPLPDIIEDRITVATVDETIRVWSVDLADGRAIELAMPALAETPLVGIRLFGASRAVAAIEDGGYALLDVGETSVDVDRIVDFSSRIALGLDALTADATAAWVQIPAGFVRWNLTDNSIDHRWVDGLDGLDGQSRPPQHRGVVDQGLIVAAASRTYLISGDGVEPLDLGGEVVATAGSWVVVRTCDDSLRCGQVHVRHVWTGITVQMPAGVPFDDDCGVAAPGDGDSVHLVLHRPVATMLVTVTADGRRMTRDIPAIGRACAQVVDVDSGVLVAHDEGLVLMADGNAHHIDLPLGPVLALGSS